MDINDLTIGQAKELSNLFGKNNSGGILSEVLGRYVIVRSRNEGINSGFVEMADETGIVLTKARRIWYHKPKDKSESWYEGVANTGLSSDSRISSSVEQKIIVEDYSVTVCSSIAKKSIIEALSNEQS